MKIRLLLIIVGGAVLLAAGAGGGYWYGRRTASPPVPQAIPASTDGEPKDPTELFVSAYQRCGEADKLASNNSIADAIRKYKESDEILSAIKKTFPTWNPEIVKYRQARVAERLQMLESGKRPEWLWNRPDGGEIICVFPGP